MGVEERKNKKAVFTEMVSLVEEVENCRDIVEQMQEQLDQAKANLDNVEQRVAAQIELLDPKTKSRFRRMMGGLQEDTVTTSNE